MGGLPEDTWQDTSTLGSDPLSNKVKLACSLDRGAGGMGQVAQTWLGDFSVLSPPASLVTK